MTESTKRLSTLRALQWLFARVDTQVPGEITRFTERLATLRAFEWLLDRVDAEVPVPITRSTERLVTLRAFVWLLARVGAEVRGEMTRSTERLATLRALEWLIARVDTEVRGEITWYTERLATLCALEWFLAQVSAQVRGETTRSTERLITLRALEWLLARVDTEVRVEITRLTERLATLRAFEWLLARVGAQVLGEMPPMAKLLPAQWTLVSTGGNMSAQVLRRLSGAFRFFVAQRTLLHFTHGPHVRQGFMDWAVPWMDPSTFFTDSYRGLEAFAKRLSDIYMTAKVSQPRDKRNANTHANKMNFHIRRDQVTFVVASNFNSEIHAMFYGRILPSLHTFPRGSDFVWKDCYSPSNFLVRSATCRASATFQFSRLSKMIPGNIPSIPARHRSHQRHDQSKQTKSLVGNPHDFVWIIIWAWAHWQCQSCLSFFLRRESASGIQQRDAGDVLWQNSSKPIHFSCGSDFCWNRLLFPSKCTSPLRDVARLCDVSIFDLSKMVHGVIPRMPSRSISHETHTHQYLLEKQI